MTRRTGLGRRRGLAHSAGDPLDGLVNLFDIGIVLAVAFLIAGLGLTLNQTAHRLEGRTPTSRAPALAALAEQGAVGERIRPRGRHRVPPEQRPARLRAGFGARRRRRAADRPARSLHILEPHSTVGRHDGHWTAHQAAGRQS